MKIHKLGKLFQKQPSQYRPFVRWWWFGGGITKEEITREMEEMAEKHIGGVEIQYIYDALEGSSLENKEKIKWLSDQWAELVQHAVSEGKRLEIQVDLTFGNGWPFGGPYISEKMASTKLNCYAMPLGDNEEMIEIPLEDLIDKPENLVNIIAVKANEENMLLNKSFSLMEYIENGRIIWDKLEGNFILFWYFIGPTGQKVKRAAPGGEGLVLDHLNKDALNLHKTKIFKALEDVFNKKGGNFGAFFCDSWEVYGENWTKNLEKDFREKKGYDLLSHIPKAIQPDGFQYDFVDQNIKAAVLYDYKQIHGEKIIKNFFQTFADICHEANVACRVQPYSSPTDLLKAYGVLDILEIEGFGKYGIGTMYYGNVDPRLASSAAHIYGKDWVSCESFTWLGEHFSVSLEQLKKEADQIILHGVHRIIYHGFPYSPPEVGNPGWVFYASIMANHNNTWWPYIEHLNKYITRNTIIAKSGKHIADHLVYVPYHDEWSGDEESLKKLRVALKGNHHLNDYDYINDQILRRITIIENGRIRISDRTYSSLILPHVEYLPLEIAKKIQDYCDQGMQLYFIGNKPHSAPGLKALQNKTGKKVKEIMDGLEGENIHFLPSLDIFTNYKVKKGNIPDCLIKYNSGEIANAQYIHYQYEDADFYFIVNEGTKEKLSIFLRPRNIDKLNNGDYIVKSLDLLHMEMRDFSYIKKDHKGKGFQIQINSDFGADEGKWIVILRKGSEEKHVGKDLLEDIISSKDERSRGIDIGDSPPVKVITLEKKWDIQFRIPKNRFPDQKEKNFVIEETSLFNWAENESTKFFSGTAIYQRNFEIKQTWLSRAIYKKIGLKLGEFYHIAEIKINGEHIDTQWCETREIDVTKFLKAGKNHLRLKITNLLLNKVIGYQEEGKKWRPDYFFVNKDYNTFEGLELLPSGLLGPVQIQFYM